VLKTTIESEFTEVFRIPSSNIYLLSGQVPLAMGHAPVSIREMSYE